MRVWSVQGRRDLEIGLVTDHSETEQTPIAFRKRPPDGAVDNIGRANAQVLKIVAEGSLKVAVIAGACWFVLKDLLGDVSPIDTGSR